MVRNTVLPTRRPRSTLPSTIAFVVATTLITAPAPAQLGPPPAGHVYLGFWADPQISSDQEQAIESLERPAPGGIGRTFAFHLHYYAWTALAQELDSADVFHPDPALLGDIDHHRVPVISWKCDATVPNSDAVIASGSASEDAIIIASAKALAQYPGPVVLRWFWEVNVLVNNQSCRGDTGGAPTQAVYDGFISAWRHIRQLFRSAGATNVVFLWNPGFGQHDASAPFYPGNEFVDWIGVDTYQRSENATFADDFDSFYQEFSDSSYGGKPLMVGENAAHAITDYGTEQQSAYLLGMLADVQMNRYPLLKAYCYFDSVGNSGNWVLDNAGGLTTFATLAASPAFSAMPPLNKRRSVRLR